MTPIEEFRQAILAALTKAKADKLTPTQVVFAIEDLGYDTGFWESHEEMLAWFTASN